MGGRCVRSPHHLRRQFGGAAGVCTVCSRPSCCCAGVSRCPPGDRGRAPGRTASPFPAVGGLCRLSPGSDQAAWRGAACRVHRRAGCGCDGGADGAVPCLCDGIADREQPNTLGEAMLLGIPCVVAYAGGAPHGDGRTGGLVLPGRRSGDDGVPDQAPVRFRRTLRAPGRSGARALRTTTRRRICATC